jgi:hypothetical protein
MCRVGTVDYSRCDEHGGDRGIGMKSRRRRGGEGEETRREWKKREEKTVGEEKGKWGERGLKRLILGQNGRGR